MSERMELVVEGRAFVGGRLAPWCIGIEKGKIGAVRKRLKGEEHLDFGDKLILPAAIDPHVHFRDPGFTKKEDFGTGSLASAFAGVTCSFDMPNTDPQTIDGEALKEKKEIAAKKSWIDYGLFAGATPSSEMLRLMNEVIGFKLYMGSSTGQMLIDDHEDLRKVMANAKLSGKVLSVHAEDESLIQKGEEEDLEDHARNRPSSAEVSAIEKLGGFEGVRVNICHISSNEGLQAARKFNFLTEATTHHMLLDKSCGKKAFAKVNPPLRSAEERAAIFEAFMLGQIDFLASDHAPHSIEEKEREFAAAPCGAPGVETAVPLMLSQVKKGALPLGTFVRASSERSAEVFGLNKGSIAEGKDADLMVVDPLESVRIKADRLHSKCGWTLYEGYEAIFPHAVFLRGQLLIEEANLVGERRGRDVVGRGK